MLLYINKLCGRRLWPTRYAPARVQCHGSWYRMLQPPTKMKLVGDTLSVSALIDLVTLTFDIWPRYWCRYCPKGGQPLYQFWFFWDFLYGPTTPTTVRRTTWPNLRPWPLTLKVIACVRDTWSFVLRLCTKFEVRRPSRSEDIATLCEH